MKKQSLFAFLQGVLLTLLVGSLLLGFGVNAAGNSRFDVNGDGVVSIQDVTALLTYLTDPWEEFHTESDWIVDTEPTCTEKGSKHTVCTGCGEILQTAEIPATGHSAGDWIVDTEPTCTEKGSKHTACTGCGEILQTAEIPATGHSAGDWVVDTEPTCTENGSRHADCASCGIRMKSEPVPPLGHSYFDGVCSRCGKQEQLYSKGLQYTLNDDEDAYIVTGIGSCTDTDIIIPATHPENGIAVVEIAASAFRGCSGITSIVIPDSVTVIGAGAFSGCSSLESMTIPFVGSSASATSASASTLFGYIFGTASYDGGVHTTQSYGSSYFSYYYIPTSLKQVTVTGGKLLYGAFYNCANLESITIGDHVTGIGDYAFSGCTKLTDITVSSGNPSYTSVDGVLFDKAISTLIQYPIGNPRSSYAIPDSVTSIGKYAFYDCSSLTNVTIGNSVTSIGELAFRSCTSLTSVTIGNSVTRIESGAFADCYKLVEVYNLSSLNIQKGYSDHGSVGYYALKLYTKSTVASKQFTDANGYQFYDDGNERYLLGYLGSDTDLVLPESCNGQDYAIYQYAFYQNNKITSVTIPDSVTSIGEYAFYYCSSLTNVTIGNSVTSIGEVAFRSCSSLTSVTIPDSVTGIGSEAFAWCTSLTSVTIGNSVTSIGSGAFEYCYKLVEVYNLSKLEIQKGSWNYGMVGYYALGIYSSLDTPSKQFTDASGYQFYDDGNVRYLLGYLGSDTDLVLLDSCNGKDYAIYQYAFCRNNKITSVTIPDSVTGIGEDAFEDCTSLTSVTIGNSVTSIGECAFNYCTSLTSVTFANTKGWYTASSSTATGGSAMDVTNPSTNATNLRSTYYYYWLRK